MGESVHLIIKQQRTNKNASFHYKTGNTPMGGEWLGFETFK